MNAVFLFIKKYFLSVAFFVGIAFGIGYFLNLNDDYINTLEAYSIYYSDKFFSIDIMNSTLIFDVFIQRIKELLLIFIVGYTSLKMPFNWLYCCFLGFCNSIYIYIATVNYGFLGIIIYIATIFPQCLIIIPATIYVIMKGGEVKSKKDILTVIMVLMVICVLEAIIEVCIGYNLFGIMLKNVQN